MSAPFDRYTAACARMSTAPLELTEHDFLVLRELGCEEVGRDRQHQAQLAVVAKRQPSPPITRSSAAQWAALGGAVGDAIVKACRPLAATIKTLEHDNRALAARVLDLEASAAAREKVNA